MVKGGNKRKIVSDAELSSQNDSPAPSEKSKRKRKTRSNASPEKKKTTDSGKKGKKGTKKAIGDAIPGTSTRDLPDEEPDCVSSQIDSPAEDDLREFPEDDDVVLQASDDDEFDRSLGECSQSTSEVSGVAPLDKTLDEEEEIDKIIQEEEDLDSSSPSEGEVVISRKSTPRATPKKSSFKTSKKLKEKKGVVIASPKGRSGKEISETQKKQLQEITEFFKDRDAIDQAWKFVKEMKSKKRASSEAGSGTSGVSDRSSASNNTNSNAETYERDDEGKKPPKKKRLPSPPAENRVSGSREGIDISRLYRVPTLSRSQVTVYSTDDVDKVSSNVTMVNEKPFEGDRSNEDIKPMISEESGISDQSSSEQLSSSDLNSSDDVPDFIAESLRRASQGEIPKDRKEKSNDRQKTGDAKRRERTVEEKRKDVKRQTDQRITEADRTRTDAIKPEGKAIAILNSLGGEFAQVASQLQTILGDNDFDPLAAEIDAQTYEKMETGKYVDLKKILPKDDYFSEEDDECRLQIIAKPDGGHGLVKEKSHAEKQGINSIKKWLVAINIYATAYVKKNPHRAAEIFQYIFDIQEAANTYTWESIYIYDRVIRKLMERIPNRCWNTQYGKYWNKLLKTKSQGLNQFGGTSRRSDGSRPKREICWKFNKGKCTRGDSCFRDHKCSFCGKFGHGEHVCRAKRDKKDKEQKDNKKPPSKNK